MTHAKTLIVGIGSPHGDDAVGWMIADRLRCEFDPGEVRVEKASSPIQSLDWIDEIDRIIFCDACHGLGASGEMRRWIWPSSDLASVSWSGTHDFSLVASLQLAERLERLPKQVIIWAVETAGGTDVHTMSPEIGNAVPRLAEAIADDVRDTSYRSLQACTSNL